MSEPNRRTPRLLDDLKVIDLTSMIAGPVCGRMFSELGANVIHVEPPWGDDGRNSTTPFLGSEGVLYTVSNRSKRGIVLDLRQPRGRELILRMLKDADLFIQNMRPGVLDAQGLGYDGIDGKFSTVFQQAPYGAVDGILTAGFGFLIFGKPRENHVAAGLG